MLLHVLFWSLLVGGPSPSPIVIRHDRDAEKYVELGASFKAVCRVGRGGDGTLIAPRWVLTAGHVARGMQSRRQNKIVTFGDQDYQIEKIVVHPQWRRMGPHDLGLLKLKTAVEGIEPYGLYTESDENGQTITMVGHGKTGVGNDRQRSEDRRRRAATNKIVDVDEQHIQFVFDAPPNGTDLEGTPGPGDSGGPALIIKDGEPLVAGVSSKGTDGQNGPGTYGAREFFVRVSQYTDWIRENIKDDE